MSLPISPADAAAELLRRRKARRSLLEFTRYTKPDFAPAAHHAIIADALEGVAEGRISRLMIEAPPRHTKSELSSRRFPAWYLGNYPDKQLITSTYSGEFAQDFGRDVRQIIADERFSTLFPQVSLAPDSTAKGRWHTNHGGVYVAVGVGGPITGRGAHVALIDDPFKNRQEAESEVIRERVWHWYTSTLRTRLMPGGAIVLVMTRWHEDDLAGRLLEAAKNGGEEWTVIRLPALADDIDDPLGRQFGEALWPEWYPEPELQKIRNAIGPRDWLALYQQRPTAEEGDFFRREWLRDYRDAPARMTVYMTGDFAVTEGGGDFTELAVWGVDSLDNVYALDWWSGQASADRWMAEFIRLVKRWEPVGFVGEGGPIRRSVEPFLADAMRHARAYTVLHWLPASADKPSNARAFQALCANGRIYWPATEWAERVKDQLLRFPGGKYDDAVDACGLFGRHINKAWGASPEPKPKPDLAEAMAAPMTIKDFMPPAKRAEW